MPRRSLRGRSVGFPLPWTRSMRASPRRALFLFLVLPAAILSDSRAAAQTYTWNQTTSGNWSTAAWLVGTPTAGGGAGDILNFNGSTNYTATDNLSGAFLLNQLDFNGTGA